LMEHF